MCPTNDGIETTEHFLLLCPSFEAERRVLLPDVNDSIRQLRPWYNANLKFFKSFMQ